MEADGRRSMRRLREDNKDVPTDLPSAMFGKPLSSEVEVESNLLRWLLSLFGKYSGQNLAKAFNLILMQKWRAEDKVRAALDITNHNSCQGSFSSVQY